MLSAKQDKVLKFFASLGTPGTIREAARKCFPGVRPVEKADSQVRNAFRRLKRMALLTKVARGTYEATEKGKAHGQVTK